MSSESYEKISKPKSNKQLLFGLVAFVLLLVAAFLFIKLFEVERPQVTLLTDVSLIGSQGTIEISFEDQKSGIQSFEVLLVQDQKEVKLLTKKLVRQKMFMTGPKKINESIFIDAKEAGISDGRADLVVTVYDFSFMNMKKGNEIKVSFPVAFDTKPPRMQLIYSPTAMKPGSSGVVIYRASEEIYKHGVIIDGVFHPGFPLSATSDSYGALIGIPYDTEEINDIAVTAYDKAENMGRLAFGINLRRVKKKADRINISDGFLNKKIPEFATYYTDMTGEFVDQYVYVNNEIRAENAKKIKEICSKSVPERLWEGRFKRMRRSSRRAGYAEYRSYYYNGIKIDNQVHLGIDLASVRQASVEASNNGIVAFADYLGIYGNMVILDHGQGLFSLYSHLSHISVMLGDSVSSGAELGKTGATGMAGGDHLHFSMLVNGVFVNPLEWWDKGWLQLHITNYLK